MAVSFASGEMAGPASRMMPPLSTVVYSSRALTPFSDRELQNLMQSAQARNHQERVTGVVLYDNSRFFQWLEGPPQGVERIMSSIRTDRRHTDVRIVAECTSTSRRFGEWDMKMAAQGADPAVWRGDILEPPPEIIEDLHRQPASAPTLLVKLLPPPAAASESPLAESLKGGTLSGETAKVLKSVFLSKVVPLLLSSHGLPTREAERLQDSPRVADLAELLLASDHVASLALIRELRGDHRESRDLYAPLFEPAARSLGDMWANDTASEFEVTLGLCRLQSAVRLLGADTKREVLEGEQPKVMIAPVPGELHQLVAAMDSEWLLSKGWTPKSEFPADDRALTDLLSTTWVDILDLSLSAAFRREGSLSGLSSTIKLARRASLNRNVVVVVGGRVFADDTTIALDVGADLVSRTSMNLDSRLAQGLRPDAQESQT